jgi:hypothetical protein
MWLEIGKFLFIVVLALLFFCLPTAWRVTTSLKEDGATSMAPSRPEKLASPSNNGTTG